MESRIPSESECLELLARMNVASSIVQHSIAVKDMALSLFPKLVNRGMGVNRELIAAAALLHDIMKLDAQVCHGIEAGDFLRKKGFHEVAAVVEKHCLNNLDEPELVPKSNEEKLLMYADLRINAGKVVSLDERFEYIRQRYKPKDEDRFAEYQSFARQLEWELLGDSGSAESKRKLS
jgi:putative nucleotidyltransferase with HDIG domain